MLGKGSLFYLRDIKSQLIKGYIWICFAIYTCTSSEFTLFHSSNLLRRIFSKVRSLDHYFRHVSLNSVAIRSQKVVVLLIGKYCTYDCFRWKIKLMSSSWYATENITIVHDILPQVCPHYSNWGFAMSRINHWILSLDGLRCQFSISGFKIETLQTC